MRHPAGGAHPRCKRRTVDATLGCDFPPEFEAVLCAVGFRQPGGFANCCGKLCCLTSDEIVFGETLLYFRPSGRKITLGIIVDNKLAVRAEHFAEFHLCP